MKKILVGAIVLVSLISMFLAFIPDALGQPENVQVLSYSWYYSQYGGYLIVVGEVQNVGPNIIDYVQLGGVVFAQGEAKADGYTRVLSDQILPQQKAPFRLIIDDESSYSGDLSWVGDIGNVEFEVLTANQTDYYQYQGLEITGDSSSLDQNGFYEVTGNIQNTGNQTTGRYWVVATFYNASGNVIAAGYSSYLTPANLPPGQTTSFLVSPRIDFDFDYIPYQIASYALSIQMEGPLIPEFPAFLILPLFMVATLFAVVVYRRLLKRASK
jgi:hypothetical protein